MSSNDYLGLARSRALLREVDEEYRRCSSEYRRALGSERSEGGDFDFAPQPLLGSTGSRLLSGNSAYYEEIEDEVAAFFGASAGA